MKQVLLDTSFILSAVGNRIDFMEELRFMGFVIIIPKQVVEEIEKIVKSKKTLKLRKDAELALKFISSYSYKKVDIGEGHVDERIAEYLKKNKEILIATLDNGLANKLKNQRVIIRNKKQFEVVS